MDHIQNEPYLTTYDFLHSKRDTNHYELLYLVRNLDCEIYFYLFRNLDCEFYFYLFRKLRLWNLLLLIQKTVKFTFTYSENLDCDKYFL